MSSSDFALAQLLVRVQLHWPEPKWFRIGQVIGLKWGALAEAVVISYWPSYRSEVSCIGPSGSDFVLAKLQVPGQRHWPDPKWFRIGQFKLQVRGQLHWSERKWFRFGQVTGPRSVALTWPEVISYWPSYKFETSCIGLNWSDFVLDKLQVRGQLHWPDLKWFRIGPVTKSLRLATLARAEVISFWPSNRSEVSCICLSQSDFVSAKLQVRCQRHWPELKWFRISQITGPMSGALARDEVILYWPSYRSKVSGVGLSRSDFVLAKLQVRSQVLWPEWSNFVLAQLQVRSQLQWPSPKMILYWST